MTAAKAMCMLSNQPKCMDQVPLQNANSKGPHIKGPMAFLDRHKCMPSKFTC
jgi:hypothetical protein